MNLPFQLVSSVNVYNVTFVSMRQTLKEIKENQVSRYQERILCESMKISLLKNRYNLNKKLNGIKTKLEKLDDSMEKEQTMLIFSIVESYQNELNRLQNVLTKEINCQTYDECKPIFAELENKMREIILFLQKDLNITTKLR